MQNQLSLDEAILFSYFSETKFGKKVFTHTLKIIYWHKDTGLRNLPKPGLSSVRTVSDRSWLSCFYQASLIIPYKSLISAPISFLLHFLHIFCLTLHWHPSDRAPLYALYFLYPETTVNPLCPTRLF